MIQNEDLTIVSHVHFVSNVTKLKPSKPSKKNTFFSIMRIMRWYPSSKKNTFFFQTHGSQLFSTCFSSPTTNQLTNINININQPTSLKVKSMSATKEATLRKALPKACGSPASVGMPTWRRGVEQTGFCWEGWDQNKIPWCKITVLKTYIHKCIPVPITNWRLARPIF